MFSYFVWYVQNQFEIPAIFSAADEDADVVLEEDPELVTGLLAKAEAQYHQGAFEHSLKWYYRYVSIPF